MKAPSASEFALVRRVKLDTLGSRRQPRKIYGNINLPYSQKLAAQPVATGSSVLKRLNSAMCRSINLLGLPLFVFSIQNLLYLQRPG